MKWETAGQEQVMPPAELLEFNADDWPIDGDLTDSERKTAQFDRWTAARHEWAEQHEWPGGFLKRIRQEYRDRHILHTGRLPIMWEAQGITE